MIPLLFLLVLVAQYFSQVNLSPAFSPSKQQLLVGVNPDSPRFKRSDSGSIPASRCGYGQLQWAKDGQCYVMASQGPCPTNMIIISTPEDISVGKCVCANIKTISQRRYLIYNSKFDQCYEIYTTGPCSSDKWVVIKDGKPACGINPCVYFTYYVDFASRQFVSYNDECVELYKASPLCSANQIISFAKVNGNPFTVTCASTSSFVQPLAIGVPDVSCPEGQAMGIDNHCWDVVEFDFD